MPWPIAGQRRGRCCDGGRDGLFASFAITVALPAGPHTLRVVFDDGGVSLHYITIDALLAGLRVYRLEGAVTRPT